MARNKERENSGKENSGDIDAQKAREERVSPEEAREINEGRGDGANPEWWKNEDRSSGEVH